MAAVRLLLMSVLLAGLVPVSAQPVPTPDVQVPAGPVSLEVGAETVHVAVDPSPAIDVDAAVDLPLLPDLSVEARRDRQDPAIHDDPSVSASASRRPLPALLDAPPAAIVAGSSLLATALALAAWLAKSSLGLFSRIEDDALATHPLRRQALDHIAANPGATLQDVRRCLGIAWGTAVYHLGRLERAGLVAVRHREGRRGHWPIGQAPARDALAPTGEALARLVRERPGLAQNELARLAGIGPPAACKQLRRLESAGFVQARRSGRTRLYVPTASLDGVLAKAVLA